MKNKLCPTTAAELKEFENISALTIEGLKDDEKNLSAYEDWMHEYGVDTSELIFNVVKGSIMNKVYKLRGNDAYPDDLSIVVATGINTAPLTIPRFMVGARWFDDIVANNAARS